MLEDPSKPDDHPSFGIPAQGTTSVSFAMFA
jgi:hypothetical protein